ncbi:MAG: sigma-E factor regulatory protein RseB domain-containing protein [Bryobacterales bacterium]|nr:outer membrane lipoprotein-sorting protein [Bryobacteraceae bacterium]MDW8129635.1 sigma-E factor regulatory protein RseB domain-containing protein [Bryobacterales bacterium]
MRGWVLLCVVAAAPARLPADPGPVTPPPDLLGRYLTAVESQQNRAADLAMHVEIDAEVPRLRRSGRLQALRFITRLGQITYRILRFEGDESVKKDIIARYLAAEQKAKAEHGEDIAITPANYRFRYKGTADYAGRTAYVFQVTPKHKRIGLFKGELWIDSQTFLPLREWGEMVKNPSVFLRNVYFVRDYFIRDDVALPRRVLSDISTRLVGKVRLTIWFDRVVTGEQARLELSAWLGPAEANGSEYSNH